MLKSFSTHNFIHFTQPQRLEFKEGVNLIIGGNSSGKSAIFELIRRCLSNDMNTTYSSFNVDNGFAYAVCHFEISERFPLLDNEAEHTKPDNILACFFVEKSDVKNSFHYYKVLSKMYGENMHVFVKRMVGDFASDPENLRNIDPPYLDFTWKTCYVQNITDTRKDVTDPINVFWQEIKRKGDEFCDDPCTEIEMTKLYKWIENGYVGVMPMRSIGPLQWTRSERVNHEYKTKNYEEAWRRAEILNALPESNQIDHGIEQKFHDAIVFPYTFEKKFDGIWVSNNAEKTTERKPLLKTPEGILEAKQLTLILSHKGFLTITLEEPDHGMHPHMIMKLRDWVLKKIPRDKVVLVTSHQSAILDNEMMERTHLCTRTEHGGIIAHSVCTIPPGYKRFGRMEEMKQLLFSPRILFVPGYTDQIIIEAMFSLFINSETLPIEIFGRIDEDTQDKIRKFLISFHIVDMHGETSGVKKKEFCDAIQRTSFRLYDLDMVFKDSKITGKHIKLDLALDKTFNTTKDFYEDFESVSKFDECCSRGKVFVWKYGTIEDVINTTESCLEKDVKERLKIPIKVNVKRSLQEWKSAVADMKFDDIQILAKTLIETCDEIKRFFKFLLKMRTEDLNTNN